MDIKKLSKISDSVNRTSTEVDGNKLGNKPGSKSGKVKDSLSVEDVISSIKEGKKVYNKSGDEYFYIPKSKDDLKGIYGIVYPENEEEWNKIVEKFGEPDGDADFFAYGFATEGDYGKFGETIFSFYAKTLTKYREKDLKDEFDDLDLEIIKDGCSKAIQDSDYDLDSIINTVIDEGSFRINEDTIILSHPHEDGVIITLVDKNGEHLIFTAEGVYSSEDLQSDDLKVIKETISDYLK